MNLISSTGNMRSPSIIFPLLSGLDTQWVAVIVLSLVLFLVASTIKPGDDD